MSKANLLSILLALALAFFIAILFFGSDGILATQHLSKNIDQLRTDNISLNITASNLKGEVNSLLLNGKAMEQKVVQQLQLIVPGDKFYKTTSN